MGGGVKKGLFYFVFVVLLFPALEHKLQFIESGKLDGGFRNANDTEFTISGWIDGRYQQLKEQYVNDQTGFRPDLVRMNNQIDFSFFDKCHAGWARKGKDHYMYQSPYINSYNATDFAGYDNIVKRAAKLKALQDTLGRLGKSVILVFLPSKVSSYPEYLRDYWLVQKTGMTNYEAYRHVGDSLGLNMIDMDNWFVSMKNKSPEPLFSKQGIHFTVYGAILASDSLARYMEAMRHVHQPHPKWSKIEHTDELRGGDNDVASSLNLIFPLAKETLAYPVIEDVPDSGQKKLNAVYIGDSYMFKMIVSGMTAKMNDECEYWGYFDDVHDIKHGTSTYIKDNYNWKASIDKTDCVVLAYTTFNFANLGHGFIEAAYDRYFPNKSSK